MTERESSPVQQKGETDKQFFARWKKHDQEERGKRPRQAVWLKDAYGKKVEISCLRSPKVHGTVKAVDLRFGRVMIENDQEIVEVNMSDIAQVRYPK